MKYLATEYLQIDLETEQWECRRCDRALGSARENFKKFTLIHPRDPAEIHPPKLDPERFSLTFSPKREFCVINEYYCPGCGTMVDVEYTVPGHEPLHDIELDLDSLKEKMRAAGPVTVPGEGFDVTETLRAQAHQHEAHGHGKGDTK